MKPILPAIVMFTAVIAISAAAAANQVPATGTPGVTGSLVTKTVVLQVSEKDPRIAFSSALLPVFGPQASANYVSLTPVEWRLNADLKKAANVQSLVNLLTLGAGLVADIAVASSSRSYLGGGLTALGYVAALVENYWFGERMAEAAVQYNKDLYKNFSWEYPVPQP